MRDTLTVALLRDPRFAPHVLSMLPVWLWSSDGARMLWSNRAAAVVGGNPTAEHAVASQIERMAKTLPHGASPRLQRLHDVGGAGGQAITCACSRVVMPDGTPGILAVATEPAGPLLTLEERARGLLEGSDAPLALYAPGGKLLDATAAAHAMLEQGVAEQSRIGALVGQALAAGRSEAGLATAERIGSGDAVAVLVRLPPSPGAATIDPKQPVPAGSPATVVERRHPLRFVWQIDAESNFSIGSEEFINLVGAQTAAKLARPWGELNADLQVDPDGQIERLVGSRETWSGITLSIPADGARERLAVELAGLPVFDRDRNYRGYRGFGICRDIDAIETLLRVRESGQAEVSSPDPRAAHPPVHNVTPLHAEQPGKPPGLTPIERKAFRDLANRLTARLRGIDTGDAVDPASVKEAPSQEVAPSAFRFDDSAAIRTRASPAKPAIGSDQRPILDRLPVGILVYRLDRLIYANRAFLDWTGYSDLGALEDVGGLDALFVEPRSDAAGDDSARSLAITTNKGDRLPVDARLFTTPWDGESALVLMLTNVNGHAASQGTEPARQTAHTEVSSIRALLDGATDGVVVLDRDGNIVALNRSAETLFAYQSTELAGTSFAGLFAPESQHAALDYIATVSRLAASHRLGTGRELTGRTRPGTPVPLFMVAGRIGDSADRLCAVFRDLTPRPKKDGEVLTAGDLPGIGPGVKPEFLAKLSHEFRTPLNSIIGFSELMMEERFGPVPNERYRRYLEDIHVSGGHLISLLNGLLDLSRIEAGKFPLTFTSVDLNAVIRQCIALIQPHASRARIIVRTSLPDTVQPVVADAGSVRQMVLNLLSNAIKSTGAGGQIIVSTATGDNGHAVLRVRDTGIGMSERDAAVALEPFKQLAVDADAESDGTGLRLPLTKALAEVNRATFRVKSAVSSGTLVEIAFSGTRIAAE